MIRFKAAVILSALIGLSSVLAGRAVAEPDIKRGKEVYFKTCAACHGEDGTGAFAAVPDMTTPDSLLATESDSVLLHHILNGFQDGRSPIAMPANGGNDHLTIRDVNAVLKYMQETFRQQP